jgi:hypothetical protein
VAEVTEERAPWVIPEALERGEDESVPTLVDADRLQSLSMEERREWALTRPRPDLKEMARLALLGFKERDIATTLGRGLSYVRVCMRSPLFQQHLEELHKERDGQAVNVADRIAVLARIALDHNEARLLDEHVDDEVKDKIAAQILDRAGYTGKMIGEHVQKSIGNTYQQINIYTMTPEEKEARLNELMIAHRANALGHKGGKS